MNYDYALIENAKTIQSFHQLDDAISKTFPSHDATHTHPIIGQLIPVTTILVDHKKAAQQVKNMVMSHWQSINLFLDHDLQIANIETEQVQARIQQFFESANGMPRLMQYLIKNHRLHYGQFLSLIFEKDIHAVAEHTGLTEIVLFKVQDKYLIQPIFSENAAFYRLLIVKKMCSILTLCPLDQIEQPTAFMQLYKHYLSYHCTKNRIAIIIHQHVQQLDYENKKTFELKQLHIFNIINHYLSGRRSLKRLHKCIEQFTAHFAFGQYRVTEKEQTLFYYLLFMRAIHLNLHDHKVIYAKALLENERLSEHAVEVFFEFGEALKVARPIPESIVKYYPHYYIEHVMFLIVQTFVEQEMYNDCFDVLKQYEMASCTAIYNVLNGDQTVEGLAKIEATVQRDIAQVLQMPPQKMMEAIQKWQDLYRLPKTQYNEIARYTVRHLMNILKTLFVVEQLDSFEKILDVYKKYLEMPRYTSQLHEFLLAKMDEKTSHLATT